MPEPDPPKFETLLARDAQRPEDTRVHVRERHTPWYRQIKFLKDQRAVPATGREIWEHVVHLVPRNAAPRLDTRRPKRREPSCELGAAPITIRDLHLCGSRGTGTARRRY